MVDNVLPLLPCCAPWGDPGNGRLFTPLSEIHQASPPDVHMDTNHSKEEVGELPWDEEAVLPPLSPDTDCELAVYGPELQPLTDVATPDAAHDSTPGLGPQSPVKGGGGSRGGGGRGGDRRGGGVGKGRKKVEYPHWSILTAEDHEWYLLNDGKMLRGAAKERMEALGQRLAVEQQQYMEEQWRNGTADHKRYSFVTHEAQLHMQADVERQRQRVIAYPRLYRLYASMPMPSEAGNKHTMAMFPAGTLLSQPSGREFVCPPVPQKLSLEKLRISAPASASASAAVAAVGVAAVAPASILADLPAGMVSTIPAEAAVEAANTASDPVGPNPGSPVAAEDAPIGFFTSVTGRSVAPASPAEGVGQTLPHPSTVTGAHNVRSSSYSGSWKLPARELSKDPLLLDLAGQRKSPFHAAITASAFTTFMTTLPEDLTAGWEIPVLLTSMSTESSSASASVSVPCGASDDRVAFFDKPLLPRSLTLRQKHERVYKSAVTALSIGVGGKGRVTAKLAIAADLPAEGVPRHVADVVHTGTIGQGPLPAGSKATSPGKVQQDMAGEAATTAAPQSSPTSDSVARAAQYNLYDLGESRLMFRSHETACMREVGAREGGSGSTYPSLQPVIVRAKMEYIPKQGPEQVTDAEMKQWRASMLLRESPVLMLARVNVRDGSLMRLETLQTSDVLAMCEDDRDPSSGYQLIDRLIRFVRGLKDKGRYVLVHPPGASTIMCYKALHEESSEMVGIPLPFAEHDGTNTDIYDLHSVVRGATNKDLVPYVPPVWKPYHDQIPQIQYTYPVRVRGAPKAGASADIVAAQQLHRRIRQKRKLLPSAWTELGKGGDWDSTALPGSLTREEYAQRIADQDDL